MRELPLKFHLTLMCWTYVQKATVGEALSSRMEAVLDGGNDEANTIWRMQCCKYILFHSAL